MSATRSKFASNTAPAWSLIPAFQPMSDRIKVGLTFGLVLALVLGLALESAGIVILALGLVIAYVVSIEIHAAFFKEAND